VVSADAALPRLRIVDTANLHLHERVEDARVSDLVKAIRQDGILKNPPLVLPASHSRDAYVVLDGATRTAAFKQMGIPHTLVQEARPGMDEVSFQYWNHVVLGGEKQELVHLIGEGEGVRMGNQNRATISAHELDRTCLAYITFSQGDSWQAKTEDTSLQGVIAGLNRVQAACEEVGMIERSHLIEWEDLVSIFPDMLALVAYREMPLQQVLRAAEKDLHLPAGMTRFSVSPRALRVHYPLERLSAKASIEEKQAVLNEWIQAQVRKRKVRYYSESTYLFDE
jgi:hypothetical protein